MICFLGGSGRQGGGRINTFPFLMSSVYAALGKISDSINLFEPFLERKKRQVRAGIAKLFDLLFIKSLKRKRKKILTPLSLTKDTVFNAFWRTE